MTIYTDLVTYDSVCAALPDAVAAGYKPAPAPAPGLSGMFYTPAEVAVWKQRAASGPFRDTNKATGWPGDWIRIHDHAFALAQNPSLEPTVSIIADQNFGTNGAAQSGCFAIQAGFEFLLFGFTVSLTAAKNWLFNTALHTNNDITRRGFKVTINDGVKPAYDYAFDGFLECGMLNRAIMTYDYIKHGLSVDERLTAETAFRRWGYFLHTHMQYGLEALFPNRAKRDYTPSGLVESWARFEPYEKIDGQDVHAFVTASGVCGPRISTPSQYYNNRRSQEALTIGLIGLLLKDAHLIDSGKLYFEEWLQFSVFPDGTQGEYERNGDYGVPMQGLIYGAGNTSCALTLAEGMSRAGDYSLYEYRTANGIFGTEDFNILSKKQVFTPMFQHLYLIAGHTQLYMHERGVSVQKPRPETSLCGQVSHINGEAGGTDNYHDLGYLIAQRYLKSQMLRITVSRVPGGSMPPFPGLSGNQVSGWVGPTGLFPGMLFMFGEM